MIPSLRLAPTVLLVENGRDDRQMYAEYLRLSGFHIVEIDNAADGLALASTADVVVTGIRVPGPFDGLKMVRRIRESAGAENKAIIVVTACAFDADQQRAVAAGADAVLTKPCLPETLVAEIRRALRSRPAPRLKARRSANTRRGPHVA